MPRKSVLNGTLALDDGVFVAPISTQLSLASAPGNAQCVVMPDPNGGGDLGLSGVFTVPEDYDATGTTLLRITGILDGAPSTTTIAFGVQVKALADDEAYDAALGSEQIASASSVSQADEDVYVETITLTAASYAAGDVVEFYFFIDDDVHTYTGNFLLLALDFEYDLA